MKKRTISVVSIARNDSTFLSKYAALFLTILGFLIITTAFACLGYKISNENRKNTELLNAVGLEKTLSQQISKDILVIQKEWKDSQKFNTVSFEALSRANALFDKIHTSLSNGGVTSFDNSTHELAALGAEYKPDLDKIQSAWAPLKVQIEMLGKAYKETAAREGTLLAREKFINARKTFATEVNETNKETPFANDAVNTSFKFTPTAFSGANELLNAEVTKTSNTFNLYSNDLLANVEKLNSTINQSISSKEDSNIKIQAGMTALSLGLFFILTFYFLRKNIVSDFIIFNEDKEKKAILDNINEGLFLMDTQWVIASEGSLFLHKLFGRKILIADNFKTILQESVDDDTLTNAERFVNILISKKIKGSMIDSLNPLKLIALHAKDASGSPVDKYVSVHFGQIHDANGNLKHILVGIQDSTEKQKLSMELKEEIKKNKETFSMMVRLGKSTNAQQVASLLHALKAFILDSNEKLKAGKTKEHQLLDLLHDLKNEVHGYKNDAGLMKVDILQKLLHDFEDYLFKLEKSGNVSYESFLSIPYQFQDILEAIDLIELLLGINKTELVEPELAVDAASLRTDLVKAVAQTSAKYGKNTMLSYDDSVFVPTALFQSKSSVFRSCLIHLVKNSVVHGIEAPHIRSAQGKDPVGRIKIGGELQAGVLTISLLDDGAGLSTERIRNKLAVLGINKKPLEDYSADELHQFIFEHEFSTAESVTLDAGRGVGLSYVKSAIQSMGGTIKVHSKAGRGIEFVLSIPV